MASDIIDLLGTEAKESPESLRNSRLSRHWQGHKDSVIIVNKYSGVYGLHRKIAVRQVRK